MAKKVQRGLGRGLGALLGDDVVAEQKAAKPVVQETKPEGDAVRMLPIRLIDPNKDQPRRSFNEEALQELAASIQSVGVIQPIIVAPVGERYRKPPLGVKIRYGDTTTPPGLFVMRGVFPVGTGLAASPCQGRWQQS